MQSDWYESLIIVTTEALSEVVSYFPRILGALLVLLIGAFFAQGLKSLLVTVLESLRISSMVKKTPVEHFLKNADFGKKAEELVGVVGYWLLMLVVIQTSVGILGLTSLSTLLQEVLGYLPSIISAVVVLFFGVLLAGLVESFVKGAVKTIDGHSALLFGKISSYLVITFALLAAVSELGIASEFITILFIGFVAMLTIGFGLALGLGGQHVVRALLEEWYKNLKKEFKKT